MKDERVTIPSLYQMKRSGEKIAMVTAYDYPTASVAEAAGADIILVGDSVANVVLGYQNTIPVSLSEMLHHTKAVLRRASRALVVSDMPFMSFNVSREETVKNAGVLIKEGGAAAVKLEGGSKARCEMVKALVDAEISVMGHIGLTPQSIHQMGEFKVQASLPAEAERLIAVAEALELAGVFSIVVEVVPRELAAVITQSVSVPVIGIGAGPDCDGQVLVFHDLCGLNEPHLPIPKHVKEYVNGWELLRSAVRSYVEDVRSGAFPTDANSFHLRPSQRRAFLEQHEPLKEEV